MRAFAAGLTGFALLVTGCAGDPAPPSASAPDAAGGEEVSDLAFVDGGRPGDLRLAMVRPTSFRPDEVSLSDQAGVVIADLLYDGLTEIDAETAALVPGLAQSWEAEADYRRWTFHLDPERGVGADAVVQALSPLLSAAPADGTPARPAVALTASMRSITAVDRQTVQIELTRPNAGLPWILSGLPFSVDELDGGPTGDYEVAADGASGLRLRRRSDRGGALGPSPVVEILWAGDGEQAYRLLVEGAVDGAIADPSSLADAEVRFGTVVAASTAVRFYVLNPASAELADGTRRAGLLSLADRADLITEVGREDLVAVDGLVSPSMAGFLAGSCQVGCGELDDEAGDGPSAGEGWPVDVSLRVTYAGDGQAAMARALAEQLDAAGVPTASRQTTTRELAAAIVDGSPDLFAFGWVAPAGSVDAVLPPLLRGDSPANVARLASPGLEALLDAAAETGDDEARWAILDRAQRLALAEAKVLPVAAATGTMVLASDSSWVRIRADGSIDLERSP